MGHMLKKNGYNEEERYFHEQNMKAIAKLRESVNQQEPQLKKIQESNVVHLSQPKWESKKKAA